MLPQRVVCVLRFRVTCRQNDKKVLFAECGRGRVGGEEGERSCSLFILSQELARRTLSLAGIPMLRRKCAPMFRQEYDKVRHCRFPIEC